MLLNCGAGEDSWESLELQGDQTSKSLRKSFLNIHWKNWRWSWSSITLATWCQEPTHWKRPWCWVGLGAGGEGDDRGWDSWMPSLNHVLPNVQIPEREERRLPRQCNSQKGKFITDSSQGFLPQPTQWCRVRKSLKQRLWPKFIRYA